MIFRRRGRPWRSLLAAASLAAAAVLGVGPQQSAQAYPAPVSRTDLINALSAVSGAHTVSGIFQNPQTPNQWTQKYHDITGKYPGLWGSDFLYDAPTVAARQNIVNQGKTEWANGSIVALSFHTCPPTTGSTCDWTQDIEGRLSDAQWTQTITNGTALNVAFKRRLDEAVPYLQQFKDAGIPVLFRPQHEMNEGWAWWGGRPGPDGSARLFQITHDYLVSKGLTNLVWVWNVKDISGGAAHVADYWPGASYVDIASVDAWDNHQVPYEWYQAMLNVAGGKPIALAEVGQTPTPATLTAQPRWAYWMMWSHYLTDPAWNTNAGVQASAWDSRTDNQGQLGLSGSPGGGGGAPGTGPITGLAGKCADVPGGNTANGTQAQLWTCNGSAQQTWTVAADGTVRDLGKCLDVSGGASADGTKVQIWDCGSGNTHQQWAYRSATRQLVNPATGKCLDVTGQSSADGAKLQLWACNGQTNQQWTLPS
ncbi:glycosyl hydrolase [Actinacidiphila sp. ITFR-21]|uniref:glycosyl hydrolase n=1 Tax=Actinacidiphila sp. ITFR-21 TaxID=3075199 RepID=UPI0028895164|nr:glycosyl hydrolase [Streptomyces sp. ITFR-21]WNI18028.1 glycosyl hydrolase [Streptomyces sp. ITFR-21]